MLNQLTTKQILQKYNITANKNLGQNFLIDENILRKIVQTAHITPNDIILEIGPGLGSLTKHLVNSDAKKIIAVERDPRFIQILQSELPQDKLKIIHTDALKFDIKSEVKIGETLKIVANLPYNIGTKLLTNWIEQTDIAIDLMVLMLQEEVVDRIVATPKTKIYGSLSILCQLTHQCHKAFPVSRTCFSPPPNINSAIVTLSPKPHKIPNLTFISVSLKSLFSHRRKLLSGTTHRIEDLTPDEILEYLTCHP